MVDALVGVLSDPVIWVAAISNGLFWGAVVYVLNKYKVAECKCGNHKEKQ